MRNRSPRLRSLPILDVQCIRDLREIRARHRGNGNTLRLLSVLPATVGRRPQANLAPPLNAAIQILRKRHPTADFSWKILRPRTGNHRGSPSDLPARATLEAIARANIYLVPVAELTTGDLMLLCCAMAIGLPVVTPAPPSTLPKFITSGVEGMIANYADAEDVVAQLSRVLFDIDLRMRMSHAGKRLLNR